MEKNLQVGKLSVKGQIKKKNPPIKRQANKFSLLQSENICH